jgi:hypothetical protein
MTYSKMNFTFTITLTYKLYFILLSDYELIFCKVNNLRIVGL